MVSAQVGARLQIAAVAAMKVLDGIANCDLVSDYGSVPMYAIREFREDIADDIYCTMYSVDELTDEEKDFLTTQVDWTLNGVPIGPKDRSQCQACGRPLGETEHA